MTDERFFTLARLYGFAPDKALREFAACAESETTKPALVAQRDALLLLVGKLHNNAAESPEWIRARIDETIVSIASIRD